MDGEELALEKERIIDRNGSSKPRAACNVRIFVSLIDLHDEDVHEVAKPPRKLNDNHDYAAGQDDDAPWPRSGRPPTNEGAVARSPLSFRFVCRYRERGGGA